MEGTKCCRLCANTADYKHCSALFSPLNVKNDLSERIGRLLEVPVHQDDGYPSIICRRCMSKFSSLERDLSALRAKAHSTYSSFNKENACRKRPKNTSGATEISPFTASARPPSKMRSNADRSRCRRLFTESKYL